MINLKIYGVKKNTGKETACYFANAKLENGKRIGITYDCLTGNIVLHKWYLIDKSELDEVMTAIKKYFVELIKEKTFFYAQVAMDKFIIAEHMSLSDEAIERLDRERRMLLREILSAGLMEEFKTFIMMA